MLIVQSINIARFWVTLFLITFAFQAMSVSAYVGESKSSKAEMSKQCHEHMHNEYMSVTEQQLSNTAENEPCCDDDCSMTSCHSINALLNSVKLSAFTPPHSNLFFTPLDSISESLTSLYRPPILG